MLFFSQSHLSYFKSQTFTYRFYYISSSTFASKRTCLLCDLHYNGSLPVGKHLHITIYSYHSENRHFMYLLFFRSLVFQNIFTIFCFFIVWIFHILLTYPQRLVFSDATENDICGNPSAKWPPVVHPLWCLCLV